MGFVYHFYFYLWDPDWGGAFWKTNAYAPWPVWIWLNGHTWAQRQCELANCINGLMCGFPAQPTRTNTSNADVVSFASSRSDAIPRLQLGDQRRFGLIPRAAVLPHEIGLAGPGVCGHGVVAPQGVPKRIVCDRVPHSAGVTGIRERLRNEQPTT
jgi:hypothetical protein